MLSFGRRIRRRGRGGRSRVRGLDFGLVFGWDEEGGLGYIEVGVLVSR